MNRFRQRLRADQDYQALLVAALCHDIGKLLQRGSSSGAKQAVGDRYRWYDPGRAGVVHEMWGADFARRHFPEAPLVETLILRHHRPESDLEQLLRSADHLAAGERDQDPASDQPETSPLLNVLSEVRGIKGWAPESPPLSYLPLRPVAVTREALFPVATPESAIGPGDYAALAEAFDRALTELAVDEAFPVRFAQLQALAWQYLSAVPSAVYRSVPDISLFDHHKATAAVAACLYQGWKEGTLSTRAVVDPFEQADQPLLLLVGGDVSGVQSFIYNVTHAGALRGLKGRSAYLQFLTWALAYGLAEELGLPAANVLYAAGGHFFLLAPLGSESVVETYRQRVERVLLDAHQGDLAVVMASAVVRPQDLKVGGLGSVWSALFAALAERKEQKLLEPLREDPSRVLGPFGEGGGRDRCASCRREMDRRPAAEDEEPALCDWCESFAELGWQLAHLGREGSIRWRPVSPRPLSGQAGNWRVVLAALGWEVDLQREASAQSGGYLLAFHELPEPRVGAAGVFPMALHAPLVDGKVRDFGELSDSACGLKRWGILRADVDDLGKVFAHGLGDRQSLSRYAALSSRLALFFGAWVDHLVHEVGGEKAYAIYSGGDDLFVVASWDVLPELARRLREDFRAFCGGNPHLTLSAAIYLAPSDKFPVRQAAEDAGSDLDGKAKGHARTVRGQRVEKDAVAFLGVACGWDDEWTVVEKIQKRLVELVEGGVARAVLRWAMAAAELYTDKRSNGTIRPIWRFYYQLDRMARRYPQHGVAIRELGQWLLADHAALGGRLALAARWAEFLTRKEVRAHEREASARAEARASGRAARLG